LGLTVDNFSIKIFFKDAENLKGKNKRLGDFEEIDEMEKQKIGKKTKIPDVGEDFNKYLSRQYEAYKRKNQNNNSKSEHFKF